jgi:AraC-like DNA-binding protein
VQKLIHALTQGVDPMTVSDERIMRAVAFIKRNLDSRLTLEDVAAEAYLSPSRFRHLFVEQTGMALRPYILWRRFLRVWELLMAGESLSTAAHAAGFADAAHLTRTSRCMFGLTPSTMRLEGPLLPGNAREGPRRDEGDGAR